jgi:hypothetical protein
LLKLRKVVSSSYDLPFIIPQLTFLSCEMQTLNLFSHTDTMAIVLHHGLHKGRMPNLNASPTVLVITPISSSSSHMHIWVTQRTLSQYCCSVQSLWLVFAFWVDANWSPRRSTGWEVSQRFKSRKAVA